MSQMKRGWGWCLGGAYFLAKFQAGGAYSGGAYKKACIWGAYHWGRDDACVDIANLIKCIFSF